MDRQPKHRPGWETVVCIAGGPSLTAQQMTQVFDARQDGLVRVIGVNNAYQLAPFVDVVFAVDLQWWKSYYKDVAARVPDAETVTIDASAQKQFQLRTRIRGTARDGLGQHEIHTGSNGGHSAVNLAYLWGARRIILLGYDMKAGPRGERHWHPDHPKPCIQQQHFDNWIHRFKSTAADLDKAGVSVWNCTPGSALPWFPRIDLDAALEMLQHNAHRRDFL